MPKLPTVVMVMSLDVERIIWYC